MEPYPPSEPPPRFRRPGRPHALNDLGSCEVEAMNSKGLAASSSHPVLSPRPKQSLSHKASGEIDTESAIHWRRLRRGLQQGRVHDHFVWCEEDELGRGSFGRVFRGKSLYDSPLDSVFWESKWPKLAVLDMS